MSLIMPVWRPRPDWLREAVTSALATPGCPIELIVVDDGNEDPVETLLTELVDPRLRILRVEHNGPYAARNAGLHVAAGSHVRFVDADDVIESGSTGRLLSLAEEREDVVAYGATLMCDDELTPVRIVTSALEGDVVEACVLDNFDVYVVSMLFPRAVVDRAGPWDESSFRVSGDWDFVLRALEHATVRRLDDVVTRYRRHRDSMTRRADVAAGADSGRLVLDRYFGRHPEQRGSPFARRAYARLHLDRAQAHASRREPARSARELGRAARVAPFAAALAPLRWLLAWGRGVSARGARRVLRPRRMRA